MSEILRLVLTNFWPFVAAVILISVIGEAIRDAIKAARRPAPPKERG